MTRQSLTVETDSGAVTLTEAEGAIVAVTWRAGGTDESPLLREAATQLKAYFAGDLRDFDLPLNASGSDFQRAVWDQMLAIPYGETRSYGELAKATGGIARAVGTACGDPSDSECTNPDSCDG